MKKIGRLLTAMITPFDKNGNIDYIQSRKLANSLINSGSDGLVIGGTTGEAEEAAGGTDGRGGDLDRVGRGRQ